MATPFNTEANDTTKTASDTGAAATISTATGAAATISTATESAAATIYTATESAAATISADTESAESMCLEVYYSVFSFLMPWCFVFVKGSSFGLPTLLSPVFFLGLVSTIWLKSAAGSFLAAVRSLFKYPQFYIEKYGRKWSLPRKTYLEEFTLLNIYSWVHVGINDYNYF